MRICGAPLLSLCAASLCVFPLSPGLHGHGGVLRNHALDNHGTDTAPRRCRRRKGKKNLLHLHIKQLSLCLKQRLNIDCSLFFYFITLNLLAVTFVMSLTTAWRLYVWSLIYQYPRTAEKKLLKLFVYPFLWLYRCHSNPPAAHSLLCFCPAGVPGVAHSWRAVLSLSFPLMCPLSGSFSVLVSFVISAGIIVPRFGVIYHRRPRRRHTSNHGGRVSTWKQIRGKAGVHLNKNM